MRLAAGDRVTVRGANWRVEEATPFGDTTLLHLYADEGPAVTCRLLTPFDRPSRRSPAPGIRAVSRRAWMGYLRTELGELRTAGQLRAPQRASIDILPFQLEPALALVRGHASRFLLADEVGLGKTIQAGLMLSELRLRGWCEHALIVTPAGLRQQWLEELRQRFNLSASVVDASSLAALTESLPFGVNPWSVEPLVITSIDFLKQPEVLKGLTPQLWDVLIVDEAHQAANASLRCDAVNALAGRSRQIILLTATPHAGDDLSYRALCNIGKSADDDPILRFRRTRSMAGLPRSRRVHLLPVRATPDESALHRLLDTYLARLWTVAREDAKRDAQLVAMVLAKRAFSSARSLMVSLERRLAGIRGELDGAAQAGLPFDLDTDETDEAVLPIAAAFEWAADEGADLKRLIDAAKSAARCEGKMRVLRRLAQRVAEPFIIFTEYRDTLHTVRNAIGGARRVVTLHGGHTAPERRQAVHAFTGGAADVLIATDAGSEGLNLHATCRLVVNLELPWNPIRLEQRIGRVDRIGQARTVHAINLLADGTAERTVLASLLKRIDRIRMSEIEVASCVINRSPPAVHSAPPEGCTETIDLAAPARSEAARITDVRRWHSAGYAKAANVVPLTVLRSREPALIAFFITRLVSRAGRLIEHSLVPVRVPLLAAPPRLRRKHARSLAESVLSRHGSALTAAALIHARNRAHAIAPEVLEVINRSIRRERSITEAMSRPSPLVQPGLFDRRALKIRKTIEERETVSRQDSATRQHLLEADSAIRLARDPELALILILCSPA